MINKFLLSSLLGGFLLVGSNAYATGSFNYPSVWQCDQVKKNWYCDEEILKKQRQEAIAKAQEEKAQFEKSKNQKVPPMASEAYKANASNEPTEAPKTAATPPKKKLESLEDVKSAEDLRELLKAKEDKAIMMPTEENVKDYLEVWQVTQEKASMFADQWQRVVWKNPKLDYSIEHPTSTFGLNIKKEEKAVLKDSAMQDIAQKHGIIFFFRSDCPYCHATSKVIKEMEQRYGLEVVAATLDGGGLPEYPNYRDGRKLGKEWGVDVVPALFIADKETAEHAPIGFGAMSMSEIVDRMYQLTNVSVGEGF